MPRFAPTAVNFGIVDWLSAVQAAGGFRFRLIWYPN